MLFTHSKVFEEHIAPLVLDVGQHDEHAEDHAGDDRDDHHQSAVKHLQRDMSVNHFPFRVNIIKDQF